MRVNSSKRLTVLSEAERLALYSLPDFDDFQRAEYLALSENELALVLGRKDLPEQIYCLLQIGYFKAKQIFFHFFLQDAPPEDVAIALQRYFPGMTLVPGPVSQHEYYENEGPRLPPGGIVLSLPKWRRSPLAYTSGPDYADPCFDEILG